jgi:glycosyltransferase involved in cell wall biosynthesis
MKTNPVVSAIIPTYNRAKLVREAVDSVLAQTYPNVEVIVVDDGSTDDTQAQLRQYGNRIRVIAQSNAGPAAARNRGIAAASGDLISFLDSDDLWLPQKLERQVALLQKVDSSVPCCLCNITMRWEKREFGSFERAFLNPPVDEGVWVNVDEVLATRFLLFNQGIVIRREVLERIGGFDESLRLLEDHEFSLRLSLEGPWAFIREPLVIWRESTAASLYQSAQKEEVSWIGLMVQILEKHLGKVKDGYRTERLRQCVTRELKSVRRQLTAARISQMSSWGAPTLGNSLRKIERYRRAVFIRSPWFPKMKVELPGGWESRGVR